MKNISVKDIFTLKSVITFKFAIAISNFNDILSMLKTILALETKFEVIQSISLQIMHNQTFELLM